MPRALGIPQSRTLQMLWRATFWVSFPFGILSFVLPIYGKELGATALEVGGFFSAVSLVPVVVRPFLGRALDRWGRRPFLLLGLLGYVIAMVIFCLSDTVLLLTVARFVQGLGQAFLWISAYTIVADVAEQTGRGHDFGTIDEAVNRGAIIGTMAGLFVWLGLANTGLDDRQVWFWLFAAYTAPALLALGSGWRGVPETRPQASTQPIESRPVSGQLLALMGIVFVTGASTAMVWPLLMVFLQDALRADVIALVWAYLPAALISAFLPSRMGRIADRLGRKGPMIAGLIVGAAASALIPHLRSIVPLVILWAVESLGYTASVPAERAFVADIAGQDTRGTSYGLYTFAYFLGAALGPLAGGWLYDNLGHATPFYLNAAVLVVGALLVAGVLREPEHGFAGFADQVTQPEGESVNPAHPLFSSRGISMKNSRQRLLTALDGGEPDRVPCALSFYHVDLESLVPPGQYRPDLVDVNFVEFPLSPEEKALERMASPYSPDTRLGSTAQVATYARWDYRPQTPEYRSPLAHARSLDDLRNFPFPEVNQPYHAKGLARQVKALHVRGLAAGGNLPHLGGELFEAAWRLRGLENFLIDLLERPTWVHFLLDQLADLARRNAETLAQAGVDVLALDDDVGMPGTMIIGPATWREFFKPRLAKIIQAARAIKPDLRILYHSDGYFEPIVGDLMEIGVNAINPLQPDHMDAVRIRQRFGPRLALWGTVGYHTTFSFARPDDIRREVKHRVETLGRAGLILCPAYDIDEPDIPWENIAAFLEAVKAYGA